MDNSDPQACCLVAGGPGLCPASRAAITGTAEVIDGWLREGIDLDADILPVIRARTTHIRISPIRTWAYFSDAVRAAWQARLRREADPRITDQHRFFADWINSDRYLPPTAVTNTMARALLRLKLVTKARLSETQRRALVIADNRIAENAGWDEELLASELAALRELNFDLDLVGFTDAELAELMGEIAGEIPGGAVEGEDDIPEPPAEPVSRPGDLWILGPYRLLCGDSTVATDVERALDGITPLLMVTDPPYGVECDPSWRNQTGASATKRTGKVLNDDRADWREACRIAYRFHARGRYACARK